MTPRAVKGKSGSRNIEEMPVHKVSESRKSLQHILRLRYGI